MHLSAFAWMRAFALGLVGLLALRVEPAAAQGQPNASFTLIGHIEKLTRPDASGKTIITVRGIDVVLPKNLQAVMPGGYLTLDKLFLSNTGDSGLALRDSNRPPVPFEAEVIGNIVGGTYVAGLLRISQGALHVGAGFIQAIDGTTGELRVGAKGSAQFARVRLNDPTGIYGPASTGLDDRFALDPGNSPVHADTGFPVCIPTSGNAANCPPDNRPNTPKQLTDPHPDRFTCGAAPAAADALAFKSCLPSMPVPLRVGDYITYVGMLQVTGTDPATAAHVIAAYGLTAALGIYTSPGVDPAYVFLEEAIQGTSGAPFPPFTYEATARLRVVGFTTDPSRNVQVGLFDGTGDTLGTCTGTANCDPCPPADLLCSSFAGTAGLTPASGPPLGRFRSTWPFKTDLHKVRRNAWARIAGSRQVKGAGWITGQYLAPVNEYKPAEGTTFGKPAFAWPVAFENFCFLLRGEELNGQGVLQPFPKSGHDHSQLMADGTSHLCGD